VAIKVIVNVDNAADWIAYAATARFRLDRAATADFAASTEVTTTVLVSGTDRYEAWDAGGSSTSWYRFRIEDDADVGLSDWSTPWQVLERQDIATLASVKQMLGTGATSTDDDVLGAIIAGTNGAILRRIGYYPGPSDDTTRTYDGNDAVRDGKRLWVPGGIRSLTELTIGATTGATKTAATATDYVLGPSQYGLRPGEPYYWIEFVDVTTGSWSSFPEGYANVTATGIFGWGAVPEDLVYWASWLAVQMWKVRASSTGMVGSTEFGNIDLSRLPSKAREVIDSYRLLWIA
jgi:hypothetical protein